ncbi:MAG: AMIN domain-containing protein [Acidobacteriales bacterium]|nr:AMIN domain-containing protein [Terriglobales bacterium]
MSGFISKIFNGYSAADRYIRPGIAAGALAVVVICIGTACLGAPPRAANTIIRGVALAGTPSAGNLEVEISASQPVAPQVQVLSGPDRLVIDFPFSTPGSALHNIAINRGEVKGARAGLFSADPPVTRVVFDLKSPQAYELVPSGNSLVIRLGVAGATAREEIPAEAPKTEVSRKEIHAEAPKTEISSKAAPKPEAPKSTTVKQIAERSVVPKYSPLTKIVIDRPAAAVAPAVMPPVTKPALEVEFARGLLTVHADKATLAEVLFQIHQRTGADIAIPSGAEQESVIGDLGPAATREVLAELLNGTKFNFIIVGSEHDPSQVRSVLLSLKEGGVSQPADHPLVLPVAQASPAVIEPPPQQMAQPEEDEVPPPQQPAPQPPT